MVPWRLIVPFAAILSACVREKPPAPPPEPQIYLREGPARWEPPEAVARPVVSLRINRAGVDIIEESEGLKLEAYALAGQWLIGYGHAATATAGMVISKEEAERLLLEDLVRTEAELAATLEVPVNDNEWSALVSLAYNLGVGGLSRTLAFERLAAGDRSGAADAFLYLDSAVIDGERRELPALKARREKERALFLKPVDALSAPGAR